jgi:hypothetical protein
MNTIERRRVVAASIFTLVALPALWVIGRHSATTSGSPATGAVGIDVPGVGGHDTAPPTSAYRPRPPVFVGGDTTPAAPGVIEVAVPPAPSKNQFTGKASFFRYSTIAALPTNIAPCTTSKVPDGTQLTVTNLDNGQFTHCVNIVGLKVPNSADIVLDTPLLAAISNLTDAPIPVRVSW